MDIEGARIWLLREEPLRTAKMMKKKTAQIQRDREQCCKYTHNTTSNLGAAIRASTETRSQEEKGVETFRSQKLPGWNSRSQRYWRSKEYHGQGGCDGGPGRNPRWPQLHPRHTRLLLRKHFLAAHLASHMSTEGPHKWSTLGPSQNTGEPPFPLVKCTMGTLWRIPPPAHPNENCQPLPSMGRAASWAHHTSFLQRLGMPPRRTRQLLLSWEADKLMLGWHGKGPREKTRDGDMVPVNATFRTHWHIDHNGAHLCTLTFVECLIGCFHGPNSLNSNRIAE